MIQMLIYNYVYNNVLYFSLRMSIWFIMLSANLNYSDLFIHDTESTVYVL